MINNLTPSISYVLGDSNFPCPNIYIVSGHEASLLIDVSNKEEMLSEAFSYVKDNKVAPIKYVAITHFHLDHIDNLRYLPEWIGVFCSKFTLHYLHRDASVITEDTKLDLGDKEVELILSPSLHSKGSLLVLADSYLFLGDCLAPRDSKDGGLYYDKSLAYEMDKKISSIPFSYGVNAHPSPLMGHEEVISYLSTLKKEGWNRLAKDW